MKGWLFTGLLFSVAAMVWLCSCTLVMAETAEVQAGVNPVYKFSLPSDACIPYGQYETQLGQFKVNDLLLHDGESLTVELIGGPLRHDRFTSVTLPYTVCFTPPYVINDLNVGDAYDVKMLVKAADFDAALSGVYQGVLTWIIRSSEAGGTVFTGSARIMVQKPEGEPSTKTCSLTLTISGDHGGGKVFYQSREVSSGTVILVSYGSSVTLAIRPEPGFAVGRILLNGADLTGKLRPDGLWIISKIYNDCELDIAFTKTADLPQTGERVPPGCWVLLFAVTAFLVATMVKSVMQCEGKKG